MTDPYRRIADVLASRKRVLITTHVRPDGDALGSTAAMSLGLRQLGIASDVLLLSHLPSKYAFVFKDLGVPSIDVEAAWPEPFPRAKYDALLVVDTGTWSQLPGLRERVEGWDVPKLVVDHHLTQEDWADEKLVVPDAAAAGEIVYELLGTLGVTVDVNIATALYLAIATDTGWFQFSNTRPFTLRLAATLMEAGVQVDRMYQLVYQNERAERVALQTRALQSLELLADGRLAVMRVRGKDFEETGANVPDTENLINVPLQVRTVEASVLLVEPREPGPVRVSLRSKGAIDVARFAERFGGGGHARASGLKLSEPLDTARDLVVAAMLKEMGKRTAAPTV